jgi:peptide deformylase
MALLDIKKFGDPVLRKRCKPVDKVTKDIKKLIVDMVQTMERNNGVGLAAPQVGENKRIVVIKTDIEGQEFFELVNPKILKKSKETKKEEEGCLSFPKTFFKVKRPKEIEVEGIDINGKKIKFTAEGLVARALCHEIDHLDGILFIDRLNFFQKIKFKLFKRGSS